MLTLMITGFEADPKRVTAILGLEPTSTARKGEQGQSGHPRSFDAWWLDVHPEPMSNGESHACAVTKMVDHLRGREAAFARLFSELSPKPITIYGGVHFNADAQCGLWLDPPDMAVMAACGVGWGVDLFAE